MGYGHANGMPACFSTFDVSDSGNIMGAAIPKIPTAAVSPASGNAGTYTFYATWADPAHGAPASLSVVLDGACVAMTRELGTDTLNATYKATAPLTAGCHQYAIAGTDATGAAAAYPTTGMLTISVGSTACTADFVAGGAASCSADGGRPARGRAAPAVRPPGRAVRAQAERRRAAPAAAARRGRRRKDGRGRRRRPAARPARAGPLAAPRAGQTGGTARGRQRQRSRLQRLQLRCRRPRRTGGNGLAVRRLVSRSLLRRRARTPDMRAAAVCARLAARPPMSNEPSLSAFRTVPRTGVIYVTTEASRRGFHPGDPDLVQPRAGTARDRAAAGRAAARGAGRHRRRRSRVRAHPRHLGAARGDRRALQPALPARHAVPVQRRERQRLGRRTGGADARRGQPGPRQPGALPSRLHRVRRAAGHLQGVHRDPDPAGRRARLRVHRRRPAPRGRGPRPLGAAAVEPVQPHRQAGAR